MTTKEVATMVGKIGLPYAFYEFSDNTERKLPFVCFLYTDSNDMFADDQNFTNHRTLVIELYTREINFTLEERVRGILNENSLPFVQQGEYLDDERCWITTFTTEVYITDG